MVVARKAKSSHFLVLQVSLSFSCVTSPNRIKLMGTLTLIMFLAVERQKLILPIKEWTNELGDLLQEAHDNRPQSQFCIAS